MIKPHDRIWLQVDGSDYDEGEEVITWCEDKINDTDVEYIRKDIFDKRDMEFIKSRLIRDEARPEYIVPLFSEMEAAKILNDDAAIPHFFHVLVYKYSRQVGPSEYEYQYAGMRVGK